jgi:hypothetical protein
MIQAKRPHLLKRFSLMGDLSQDSRASKGASHHHVTYPFKGD